MVGKLYFNKAVSKKWLKYMSVHPAVALQQMQKAVTWVKKGSCRIA